MKVFNAVVVALLMCAGAHGQRRAGAAPARAFGPPAVHSKAPIVVPSAGALGGSFASIGISRPFGGVAPPSFPVSGNPMQRRKNPGTLVGGYGTYIGPVYYVPNAYDSGYEWSGYSTFDQPASPPLYTQSYQGEPPPQQPIIIRQYFNTRPGAEAPESDAAPVTASPNPGDPIGEPRNYYLIAYKDHTIYSALAYWLEGDTLHYVTTQNTHNQASMALIDLEQTVKLNADNTVPFSLSGK